MQKVYFLYHVRYEDTDDEDIKLIGVYSSHKKAKLAIEKLKNKPGFIDFPDNFYILKEVLDEVNWMKGFLEL